MPRRIASAHQFVKNHTPEQISAIANDVANLPEPHKKKKKGLLRNALELPFKAVREVAKPVVKNLPKGVRNSLPVIGAIGGSLIGGPIGGIAGGALGGSMRGGRHVADHALGGAALGGLGSFGLGALGSSLGGGAGMGALGGGAGNAATSGLLGSGGLLNSLIGGGGGTGSLLNAGLLATAIGGGIRARKPKNPTESETLQDAIDRSRGKRASGTSSADWGRPLSTRPEMKQPPRGYRGTYWNYFPTPEEQEEQLRRANEEIFNNRGNLEAAQAVPQGYADGGYVEDYYEGNEGGQSDKRLVKVRPKSYIVNSTTVSLAGDGNSKNGAKVIKDWAKSFQNGHFFNNEDNRKVMKAYVSDGELKLQPEEVMAIGYGDIDRGVKTIKRMEKRMRKHKGVKKNLPPKSKPLDAYAGTWR